MNTGREGASKLKAGGVSAMLSADLPRKSVSGQNEWASVSSPYVKLFYLLCTVSKRIKTGHVVCKVFSIMPDARKCARKMLVDKICLNIVGLRQFFHMETCCFSFLKRNLSLHYCLGCLLCINLRLRYTLNFSEEWNKREMETDKMQRTGVTGGSAVIRTLATLTTH